MKKILILLLGICLINLISAESIQDNLHLNIQVVNQTTDLPMAGTYNFTFNITSASDCTGILYHREFNNVTTNLNGIVNFYLNDTNLTYTSQYWLCYFRDGILQNNTKIGYVPYTFYSNKSANWATSNNGSIGAINTTQMENSGGKLNILTSWLTTFVNSISNVIHVIWGDNNANNLLVSNGTGIGYNETVFNNSVINIGLLANFNSTFNTTYAGYSDNVSINHTLNVYTNWNAKWNSTFNATYDANLVNHTNITLYTYNTSWSSTFNTTYAGYADNVSRNWTTDTYNAWNTVWLSTFNDTYRTYTFGSRNESIDTYNAWNTAWLSTQNATYEATTNQWNGNASALLGCIGNASYLSTYNATYHNYVVGNYTNQSEYWDNLDTYNSTQMENSGGKLNILVSWLTSLFYKKSEVYNKTETYNQTEIDNNITSQGFIKSTNVAFYNNTITWAENQNFSKNITLNGGSLILNDNATITRENTNTNIWITDTGNVVEKLG